MARYTNLDGTTPDKRFVDLVRWRIVDRWKARAQGPSDATFVTPRQPNDGSRLRAPGAHLTWIGHATFVQRLGGKLAATDPVWSSRLFTVPRRAAPGVRLEDCPAMDVVTVSHDHYDHMDLPSLRRLAGDPLFVVPKDNGAVLRRAGLKRIQELSWWESVSVGDLRITLVPSQHWAMRVPWDRNTRLWGGYVFESDEGTTYHAGDTAFHEEVFRAIGQRFPRIDFALLPIGAYEPQWFMRPQHMGPEEAGRAWELLGAKTLVAMHWGTFKLTDEPLGAPPDRLRDWWVQRGHGAERLWVLDLGETRPLQRL
jgi:L-ascorbate metabolism protein UlaG (beta-lactamase superfamily)